MIIGHEPPCKSSVCSQLWHRYYRPVTRLRVYSIYDCGGKLTVRFFIGFFYRETSSEPNSSRGFECDSF